MVRNLRKFLFRYFGIIGLVIAAACFAAPFFFASMTPDDARTLWSLGGTVGGVSLVLMIASFFVRERRR
ncbi:hypothetical protein KY084_05300 [Stakelama sp. CBK3Z-3]|uniref:Uncharacterized protein n=1 Tax=Stakelama flava TaxID=2860338 RepID=A0ABS6XJ67_9SPHN|nr:hypothetical protein [Stakelama flava]MBW4330245.1 hypothetical protein [Stakelama flava]MBW4330287.1 hypothetical protein [Stakelama flava]